MAVFEGKYMPANVDERVAPKVYQDSEWNLSNCDHLYIFSSKIQSEEKAIHGYKDEEYHLMSLKV